MTADDAVLRQAEQQLLVSRPWDVAEPESLWEITGERPDGSRFTNCLSMTAPFFMTGVETPLFFMIAPSLIDKDPIDPAWITRATPLLLVHRNEPTQAYWTEDEVWMS